MGNLLSDAGKQAGATAALHISDAITEFVAKNHIESQDLKEFGATAAYYLASSIRSFTRELSSNFSLSLDSHDLTQIGQNAADSLASSILEFNKNFELNSTDLEKFGAEGAIQIKEALLDFNRNFLSVGTEFANVGKEIANFGHEIARNFKLSLNGSELEGIIPQEYTVTFKLHADDQSLASELIRSITFLIYVIAACALVRTALKSFQTGERWWRKRRIEEELYSVKVLRDKAKEKRLMGGGSNLDLNPLISPGDRSKRLLTRMFSFNPDENDEVQYNGKSIRV